VTGKESGLVSEKTARLCIQCAGSVSIDGQSAGRLDAWAYEHLAGLAPDGPPFEYGDSLVFEMRLVQVDP
jgi:hypothetical protein